MTIIKKDKKQLALTWYDCQYAFRLLPQVCLILHSNTIYSKQNIWRMSYYIYDID